MIQVKGTGFVQIPLGDFMALAVNVLDRLGYTVRRTSNQLDQVLATERLDEKVGQDWWHHEYRVVMRWEKDGDGINVTVDLEEIKGGASQFECRERCDAILVELQNDAKRAQRASAHKEKSTVYGAARWGTGEELAQNDYFQSVAEPKRLIIGRTEDKKYIQVPEYLTHAHALICGPTGCGKSRGFFVPQLIERIGTSMVVTEATADDGAGELYSLTSGWRKMAGHEIYSFNPSDMTSNRINPIDSVRWAPAVDKARRAEKLADLVIMNGESTESKHEQTWNRSEKLLLIPLILHAAATEPEQGHLGAIRWMLLQGPDSVGKILRRSPSDVAQMEFEGWRSLSGETNFKYGVFAGLITKLNPWLTDQMVALTETTDIDLKGLKNQLFTFYLTVSSRSTEGKLVGSLLLNFLLDHILEIRQEMKYPVTMLLDEFTNFGRIAGIGGTLSIIRKKKIGLVLGFQNYFQLEQVYGRRDAQIIMDQPATQVYFKQKQGREARDLSEALGRTTVLQVTVTDAGRVHEMVQGRQLITADELSTLHNEVIVFTADTKPLRLPQIANDAYKNTEDYDPPVRPEHEISEYVQKRGRMDDDQADEQEPFDMEKGLKARQGPPPIVNPQNSGKGKSNFRREEKTKAKEPDPAEKASREPERPSAAERDPAGPPATKEGPPVPPKKPRGRAPNYGDT